MKKLTTHREISSREEKINARHIKFKATCKGGFYLFLFTGFYRLLPVQSNKSIIIFKGLKFK